MHHDRRLDSAFGAVHYPIYTNAEYAFKSSRELTEVFQGKPGYTYSRQGTPTTTALEKKITLMEGGINTVSFASGMAALTATFLTLLKAGDHVISSKNIFGNTTSLLGTLAKFGVEVTFVDTCDAANVQAAIQPNTLMVFTESLANPSTHIADLETIGSLCKQHNLLYVLDNTLITPWLMPGKQIGASIVVNSLSKHIGGHANALGGSVTDTGLFNWQGYPNIDTQYQTGNPSNWGLTQIKKKGLRDMGATLASETAHRIATGIETLPLRMAKACDNAMALATELVQHPQVKSIQYPGLSSHPQHERANKLFGGYFGSLMAIELAPHIDVFNFLDKLTIFVLATHLGDNRSLVLPVAHTIYYEMGKHKRKEIGIPDNLLRVSVGIENPKLLLNDFTQALDGNS